MFSDSSSYFCLGINMEETKSLKNGLIVLIALDAIIFILSLIINQFKDFFGVTFLILMVITGMVYSELLRRQKGEETHSSYPEW